ncbi:MAG: hypothetical protein GF364_20605 [Candidatus Lokiarchaeota archaeon]|nr:hypothetical protein [Candidatus Lokiarchaeota archaeon]
MSVDDLTKNMKLLEIYDTKAEAEQATARYRKKHVSTMVMNLPDRNGKLTRWGLFIFDEAKINAQYEDQNYEDKRIVCPICDELYGSMDEFFHCWNCDYKECIECGTKRLFKGEKSPKIKNRPTNIGRCDNCHVVWGNSNLPRKMQFEIESKDGFGKMSMLMGKDGPLHVVCLSFGFEKDGLRDDIKKETLKFFHYAIKNKWEDWIGNLFSIMNILKRLPIVVKLEEEIRNQMSSTKKNDKAELAMKRMNKDHTQVGTIYVKIIESVYLYITDVIDAKQYRNNIKISIKKLKDADLINKKQKDFFSQLEKFSNTGERKVDLTILTDILEGILLNIEEKSEFFLEDHKIEFYQFVGSYLQFNKYDKAVTLLEPWMNKHSKDIIAGLMLGISYKVMYKYEKAIEFDLKMLKKYPKEHKLRSSLINCFFYTRDFKNVIKHTNYLLKYTNPQDPKLAFWEIYIRLAGAYCAKGKFKKAFEYLYKSRDVGLNEGIVIMWEDMIHDAKFNKKPTNIWNQFLATIAVPLKRQDFGIIFDILDIILVYGYYFKDDTIINNWKYVLGKVLLTRGIYWEHIYGRKLIKESGMKPYKEF